MGIYKRLKLEAAAASDQGHMWSDLFRKEVCPHCRGYPSYLSPLTRGRKAVKVKIMRFPLLNPCGSFWNRIEMISSVYSEHVWTVIACSDANRCSPCKYLMLCISWTRVSSSFLWCTAQIILLYCLFSFHKSTMHFHWSHYSVILHTLKHAYGHVTESICNRNELKLLQFISWTPNCLSLILLLFLN